MSSILRRGGRRLKTESVTSQPGPTTEPPRPAAQPSRRKYYSEYSDISSEGEEPAPPPPPADSTEQQPAIELAKEYATPIREYVVKVVADAFHLNRWFFSSALGITILWFGFSMITSQLVFFARPICSLPIVSPMIPFCHWEVFKGPSPPIYTSAGRPVYWADYPR